MAINKLNRVSVGADLSAFPWLSRYPYYFVKFHYQLRQSHDKSVGRRHVWLTQHQESFGPNPNLNMI